MSGCIFDGWLVVSITFKNMKVTCDDYSEHMENLKKIPNHQPAWVCTGFAASSKIREKKMRGDNRFNRINQLQGSFAFNTLETFAQCRHGNYISHLRSFNDSEMYLEFLAELYMFLRVCVDVVINKHHNQWAHPINLQLLSSFS